MTSEMSALSARTNNLALRHKTGDVTLRGTLESLDLGSYDHVLILADDRLSAQVADSRTSSPSCMSGT